MPDQKAPPKKPAAKKPAANPGRTYIVLHQASNKDAAWTRLGESTGATDRQAIVNLLADASAAASAIPTEGVFVAVPARSWRPVTRKVQTVEKALWS